MKRFRGRHPAIMEERVKNYAIAFDPSMVSFKPGLKDIKRRVANRIGKITGWYPGEYRNYKLLKKKLQ